jgi:hypothetical protein
MPERDGILAAFCDECLHYDRSLHDWEEIGAAAALQVARCRMEAARIQEVWSAHAKTVESCSKWTSPSAPAGGDRA